MRKLKLGLTRPVAIAALVSALGAIAGALACSLIVSDSLPSYTCMAHVGNLVCPSGQVCAPNAAGTLRCCDPRAGGCVVVDNDAGNDTMGDDGGLSADARADTTMDAGAASDADAGTNDGGVPCSGFGCKCATTANCPTNFACAHKLTVTSDIWSAWGDAGAGNDGGGDGGSGGVCMRPCCISTDCDEGDGGTGDFVCFATGAGGNYCVPPSWLGDRSTVGANSGGAFCDGGVGGDAGMGCRSGLCLNSGVCADTCCSFRSQTNECSTLSNCRFGTFPGSGFDTHEAANCAPPITMGASGGMQCQTNSECRSNLCLGVDSGGFGGGMATCRDACRNSIDCTGTRSSTQTCAYVQANLSRSTELAAACTPLSGFQQGGGDGGAGDGARCQISSDCMRGSCVQSNGQGVCLAVCSVDDPGSNGDCPPPERCRPQLVQLGGTTYSVLACGM